MGRGGTASGQRFFADGGCFTHDRKARFVAPEIPAWRTETTAARPLRLNTGRIRDQWHTMTRTGESPRLGQHLPEPFVEVHPDDAARHGVADGDFARVTTGYGPCTPRVVVGELQQRGMLLAPIPCSEAQPAGGQAGAPAPPRPPCFTRARPQLISRARVSVSCTNTSSRVGSIALTETFPSLKFSSW